MLLCERYSLTPPAVNVWIGRWQVDAVWFEHRVVVELDSRSRTTSLPASRRTISATSSYAPQATWYCATRGGSSRTSRSW